MKYRFLIPALALCLLPRLGTAQSTQADAAAADPAQARIRERLEAALLELAEGGVLPIGPQSAPIELSSPARRRYDFGAVIDLAGEEGRGLEVLGVTPGGGADGIGLRDGDRLLAINGIRLDRGAVSAAAIRAAIAREEGKVEVELDRGGKLLTLAGHALPKDVPAYSLTIQPLQGGCGRISTATVMPRTRELFPIHLRRIDGIEQVQGSPSYRVSTGRHVLMLQESIPTIELSGVENVQRDQLRKRRMAEYKFFEIDVQPDTTYYFAAKLVDYPRDVTQNAHWKPVIWRVKEEKCQ